MVAIGAATSGPSVQRSHPTQGEVLDFAESYQTLFHDRESWMIRRVKTYELIDRTSARYQFSYDLDLKSVHTFGLETNTGQLVIPLDVLPKQHFVSVSLEGPWEAQTCLATRRENTRVSCYILFGKLAQLGVDLKKVTEDQIEDVFDLLSDVPNIATLGMLSDLVAAWEARVDVSLNAEHVEWYRWVQNKSFRELVAWHLQSYFLCVSVPVDSTVNRGIIKIRWTEPTSLTAYSRNYGGPDESAYSKSGVEGQDDHCFAWVQSKWASFKSKCRDAAKKLQSLGFLPPVLEVSEDLESDVGTHFRFVVPSGMRVEAVRPRIRGLKIRRTSSIVSFYMAAHPHVSYSSSQTTDLRLYTNVKRGLFTFPALIGASISCVVVGAIAFGNLGPDHTGNMSDTVAIAALVPALLASYVALNDEHEAVSVALGFRRLLLIVGVLGAVVLSLVSSAWTPCDTSMLSHCESATLVGADADGVIDCSSIINAKNCQPLTALQRAVVVAALVYEWLLSVYFLFEIGRIQTWRWALTRRHRKAWLAVLTMVTIGVFLFGILVGAAHM